MDRRRDHDEYAVRWRIHGGDALRIRHFSNRITAEAFARGVAGTLHDNERLVELRIDKRTVGPWSTVDHLIGEPQP